MWSATPVVPCNCTQIKTQGLIFPAPVSRGGSAGAEGLGVGFLSGRSGWRVRKTRTTHSYCVWFPARPLDCDPHRNPYEAFRPLFVVGRRETVSLIGPGLYKRAKSPSQQYRGRSGPSGRTQYWLPISAHNEWPVIYTTSNWCRVNRKRVNCWEERCLHISESTLLNRLICLDIETYEVSGQPCSVDNGH